MLELISRLLTQCCRHCAQRVGHHSLHRRGQEDRRGLRLHQLWHIKSLSTVSRHARTHLEGELTPHVESAHRDDDVSLIVHINAANDESGFCSMHVSKFDGRWWLSG